MEAACYTGAVLELNVIRNDELLLIKPLEQRLVIGQDRSSDVRLPSGIENLHASVDLVGNRIVVRELNGTVFHHGRRIEGEAQVRPGETFCCGDYRFRINKRVESRSAVGRHTLTVTQGGKEPSDIPVITFLKPRSVSFCQLNVMVGRSADCQVVIPDDSVSRKNVSRQHAEIYVKNGRYYVRDLQSKNGTFLYDSRVDDRLLPIRGTLALGSYALPYQIEDPATTAMANEGIVIPSLNPNIAPKHMLGSSPAMKILKEKLDRAIHGAKPVMILGEMGTGKELCARYLHFYHPQRKAKPFVAVNCACIPPQLAASSLFGHKKGAFSGAIDSHQGVFKQADGGTLFLDEVGDLPLDIQTSLLRVIEDGLVRPVGATSEIAVDVRIICATNKNIDKLRRKGNFRGDLYHRFQHFIRVPSLRERPQDLGLLATHFLNNAGSPLEFSPDVVEMLETHPWPGNVREFGASVERAIINANFRGSPLIDCSDFEFVGQTAKRVYGKEEIVRLLTRSGGNVKAVATALGITRKTLYKKMRHYKIDHGSFRS